VTDLPAPEPPLDPEPLIGWRAWRLERRDGQIRLASLTRADVWPPRDAMRARCPRQGHRGVPSPACTCGLYAADSPRALAGAGVFGLEVGVVGPIAMWGRVVEHTNGARSAVAYPARLRLVCGTCLHTGLGAVDPRWVLARSTHLLPLCARHARRAPAGERIPAADVQADLLGTYAVDLLPRERLGDLGRPWARLSVLGVSVAGPLTALAALVIKGAGILLQVFMALLLVSTVLSFAFGVIGAVVDVVTGSDDVTAAVPSAAAEPVPADPFPVVPAPHGGPKDASAAIVSAARPEPVPGFAVVCGVGEGRRIGLVDCGAPSDLFGFATEGSPRGAARDCIAGWVAYSRGEDHSICWHALERDDPNVRPWARAGDPFAAAAAGGI
jgi:hypothetical protein